jgi:hypothetical protein
LLSVPAVRPPVLATSDLQIGPDRFIWITGSAIEAKRRLKAGTRPTRKKAAL